MLTALLLAWWFTVTFPAGDPRGEETYIYPTKEQCESRRAGVVAVLLASGNTPVVSLCTDR